MKKFGFTLAELLIALAVVGVVASLTTPLLVTNAQNAQVGPKLAKVKSTIENANRQLLQDEEARNLATLLQDVENSTDRNDAYFSMLSRYMRLEEGQSHRIYTYDGKQGNVTVQVNTKNEASTAILLHKMNSIWYNTVEGCTIKLFLAKKPEEGNPPLVDLGFMLVDINGITPPNRFGRDVFGFILENNGMLTPYGEDDWEETCSDSVISEANTNPFGQVYYDSFGLSCTATIFENDLKVTYDR